jgi:hypothetical protein
MPSPKRADDKAGAFSFFGLVVLAATADLGVPAFELPWPDADDLLVSLALVDFAAM